MKKLHLATSNDSLRPVMQYIQVKNGFCYATDCHILIKVPINEVFGDLFNEESEVYISAKDWKSQKVYNAYHFSKIDNIITVYDKKMNKIGMLEYMDKKIFEDKVGRFPDCEQVIYSKNVMPEDIDTISFNPSFYARIGEALEETCQLFNLSFFGKTRAILVQHNKPDQYTKGIGVLMPIATF